MIKVIKAGIDADVAADFDAKVKATVETTLKDIETRGDAAVRELSEKFDNWSPESFRLSDEQIAEAVGINAGTVRRWAAKPGFPSKRSDGKYDTAAVRTWMLKRPRQRHDIRLTGGRIYFQAGALAQCVDMLNPPEM